jgi:hypothetical protein
MEDMLHPPVPTTSLNPIRTEALLDDIRHGINPTISFGCDQHVDFIPV